jgi:opacity protein-like surface antigen
MAAMNWMNVRAIGRVVVLAITFGVVVAGPLPAAAEWFADVYVGRSLTSDSEVKLSQGLRLENVEFDNGFTYGGRFGTFFNAVPWLGVTFDAMSFSANIDKQTAQVKNTGAIVQLAPLDLSVSLISLDVVLRLPLLATPEIPNGRLTPYILGGPSAFIARADDGGNFIRRYQDDTEVSFGYNAGAGIGWQFSKSIGVFTEYRFTHGKPEFEFDNFDDRVKVKTTVDSHHVLIGFSFKF